MAFEPLNDEKGPPMQQFVGGNISGRENHRIGALCFDKLALVERSVGLRSNFWREGWSKMPRRESRQESIPIESCRLW